MTVAINAICTLPQALVEALFLLIQKADSDVLYCLRPSHRD